ncbi:MULTISPECIES: type II secretion system protein GspM [Desulfosediminicola]|uniref:type II secretion system protein GspM n=1 Tax=Desulfosediminicola TaxID=2886823 RepID=UPI00142F04C7|nr:type II secretion system protein GspM [Desulfosediminicola ganghwensis]
MNAIKDKAGIDQLSSREKLALALGVVVIVSLAVYQLAISPYLESRARLINSIERKKQELVQMQMMQQEYLELRKEEGGIKANLSKRPANFTLFTFIDQQAELSQVKEKINYMKPSVIAGDGELDESVVELKLQSVTLERLVEFIKQTESEQNVVSIRRISIQTSAREEGYLDVILQIATFVEAS